LLKGRALFDSLFQEVTLPVLIIDRKGQIAFANTGAAAFLGYTQRELLSQELHLRALCAPYESDRYIFSTLPEITETTYIDIDLKRKGGRVFMTNIAFSPCYHDGSPYLLLTLRDVTTRRVEERKTREDEGRYRRLLAERNVLQDQLHRSSKLAFMGELAAGIAHEINNPLGIILGFVQDMLDEIGEDHPFYESIKIVEHETARCAGVVKDLLDFARLRPAQRAKVDLLQLVENSLLLLVPQIKKNKIRVHKAYDKGLPYIYIDEHLMQQVFLNVILNAIQSMPAGGDLTLGLGIEPEPTAQTGQNGIRISVTDTGHGIPKSEIDRIFDPFFTTKGSKGSGLGLAVCQRVMEDHHGKIDIVSREGGGTTCNIYLPMERKEDLDGANSLVHSESLESR
jgi:two-component system NtrC family sensor kinase